MGDQTSDQLRCALGRLRAGDGDASTSSDGGHEQVKFCYWKVVFRTL